MTDMCRCYPTLSLVVSIQGPVVLHQIQDCLDNVELLRGYIGCNYSKCSVPDGGLVTIRWLTWLQFVLGMWASGTELHHGASSKAFSCANNWEAKSWVSGD
jgi:hypothetical protein